MNKNHLLIFVILVFLQIAVIAGIFVQRIYTLSTGVEVALRTVPVDPRDLIRGDYVTLRYEISSLAGYLVRDGSALRPGDTVYVSLRESNGFWVADEVLTEKPKDYRVFLKGEVASANNSNRNRFNRFRRGNITVNYGIEKYFIEAGTGKDLERSGRLKVIISADRNGNAVIKRVEKISANDLPVLGLSSTRGRDSSVKADLMGVRVQAEIFFDANESYGTTSIPVSPCPLFPDASKGMFSDERILKTLNEVYRSNGWVVPTCALETDENGGAYAISSPLNSGPGFWCVDSTGTSRQILNQITSAKCPER